MCLFVYASGYFAMRLVYHTRVGRKNTLYVPKAVAEELGLREGTPVRLVVDKKRGRLIVEPIPNPFELGLRGEAEAEVTFEELEEWSEEMQRELTEGEA